MAFTLQKRIVEPLVILLGKLNSIAAFRFEVGRVAIEKGILPVILPDEVNAVLVLNDDLGQPAGALPYQVKEAPYVTDFASKGFGTTAEAVSDELVVF